MPPDSVQLVVTDVDGVLTDGTIALSERGEELKRFSIHDGFAVHLLRTAGIDVAFLSGRRSRVIDARARELGVRTALSGVEDKRSALQKILRGAPGGAIDAKDVCYIGDDLVDIRCLKLAGFPVAVANAREEVKREAEYITRARGGDAAFREVAEVILEARGLWDRVLESYR